MLFALLGPVADIFRARPCSSLASLSAFRASPLLRSRSFMGKRQRQPADELPARTYSLRSRSGSQASAGTFCERATEMRSTRRAQGDGAAAAQLATLTDLERRARAKGAALVAGVDEAGRGPLAGPVVAAAVILPPDLLIEGVDDSKKLLPEKRAAIHAALRADPRVRIGIGIAEADAIDRDNILQATFSAMREAVRNVGEPRPDHLPVDGPFGIECSARRCSQSQVFNCAPVDYVNTPTASTRLQIKAVAGAAPDPGPPTG
eukprot:tig00000133_g7703.t1